MSTKYFKLDGNKCGFCLWLYETNDWFMNEKGKRYLFKSLALAKVYLERIKGIRDPYQYKVWLVLDEQVIDYDNIQFIDGFYEYCDGEIWYFIEETIVEEVCKIGYFVFENGDKVHSDKKYGSRRQKEFLNMIREAISNHVVYPYFDGALSGCHKDDNCQFYAAVKGSTCKIRFCKNDMVMTINQNRKADGVRCIPYEKSMDKFLTIYAYITKDISEQKKFETVAVAAKIQEELLGFIKEVYPEAECRYIEVPFMGTITM